MLQQLSKDLSKTNLKWTGNIEKYGENIIKFIVNVCVHMCAETWAVLSVESLCASLALQRTGCYSLMEYVSLCVMCVRLLCVSVVQSVCVIRDHPSWDTAQYGLQALSVWSANQLIPGSPEGPRQPRWLNWPLIWCLLFGGVNNPDTVIGLSSVSQDATMRRWPSPSEAEHEPLLISWLNARKEVNKQWALTITSQLLWSTSWRRSTVRGPWSSTTLWQEAFYTAGWFVQAQVWTLTEHKPQPLTLTSNNKVVMFCGFNFSFLSKSHKTLKPTLNRVTSTYVCCTDTCLLLLMSWHLCTDEYKPFDLNLAVTLMSAWPFLKHFLLSWRDWEPLGTFM